MVSSDEINRRLKNKRVGISTGGLKCSKCGTENAPDSIYCMECGGDLVVKNISSRVNAPSGNIGSKREKMGFRKTNYSNKSHSNNKSVNDAQNDFKSTMRKIPGFRSGTPWKMVSGSIGYLIIIIMLIAGVNGLVTSSFINSTPTFAVADDSPITVVGNNSSTTDNGILINATMINKGSNISLMPVQVYSQGTHIGDFFFTNVTPGEQVWFNMNITNSPINDNIDIDSSVGNLTFYPDEDVTNDSVNTYNEFNNQLTSQNPGDYKFVIDNQSSSITEDTLENLLTPLVNSYEQSMGSESDSTPIQGQLAGPYSPGAITTTYDNKTFNLNSNLTIVMEMDTGNTLQGQWVGQTSGDTVDGYQSYLEVVVIYWPEMKIVGWHNFTGPPIPDSTEMTTGENIVGDQVDPSTVEQWINSQPKI